MPDDLNEILKECAKLRGTYPLMNRTIQEFSWFLCGVIADGFGKFKIDGKKLYYTYDKTGIAYEDATLEVFVKAFLEYCKEEYGEVK